MDKNILIIDDEQSVRESLSRVLILSLEGIEVHTAGTEIESRNILSSTPVDLIISDFKLEETDGLTLAKAFSTEFPDSAILIMTAFGTEEIQWDVFTSDCIGYIEKPFEIDEFLQLVGKFLQKQAEVSERSVKDLEEFCQQFLVAEARPSSRTWLTGLPAPLEDQPSDKVSQIVSSVVNFLGNRAN